MLVSGGKIIAIDQVVHDATLSGDGTSFPLGVNSEKLATTDLLSAVSSTFISDINSISSNFDNYYTKSETSGADELAKAFESISLTVGIPSISR